MNPPRLRRAHTAGPKSEATRARLITAAVDLLSSRSMADLTALDIATHAGLSNAAFYVYFRDPYAVLLAACEHAGHATPALLALLETPWTGADAIDKAADLVRQYFALWDQDRPVLLARNIAAEEGQPDFVRARQLAVQSLFVGLRDQIIAGQVAGRIPAELDPTSVANVLLALLERTGSVQHLYEDIASDWASQYLSATQHVLLAALGFRGGSSNQLT